MTLERWDGIQVFIEVVETGSFTAAADKLGVSKSFVSKQIKALEQRYGASLLQRTTRQLTLTGVGEVLFQQCQKMSRQLEHAETLVSTMQHEPLGVLKIALNSTFGVQHMATAVAEFSQRYPQLELDVTSSYQDVDLLSHGYDITIRYGDQLPDSSLYAKQLGAHGMSLYATPEYFEQRGRPASMEALKEHNCLSNASRYWYFNEGDHTRKVRVEGNWQSEDGGAILAAARVGIGLAQLPDFYVANDVKEGKLEKLDMPWAEYQRMAWAVYPYNRHMSAKVRLFIDFLGEYLENRLSRDVSFLSLD